MQNMAKVPMNLLNEFRASHYMYDTEFDSILERNIQGNNNKANRQTYKRNVYFIFRFYASTFVLELRVQV